MKSRTVYCMALFAVLCWSTMAPLSKQLLAGLSNMEVLFYGTAIAACVLLAVIYATKRHRIFRQYTARDYGSLLFIGVIGFFLYSVLYYYGLSLLSAQTACILNYLWPIFTVLLSCILLKEPFSFRIGLALFISFAGMLVVTLPSLQSANSDGPPLMGYLACILAAFLYGLFNVLNKRRSGDQVVHMFLYIGSSAVLSFLCCLVSGFSTLTIGQILGLLWLGVFINAAGFLFWAIALKENSSAKIANLAYMTPALSLLLCCTLFQEPFHLSSLVGLVLILCGCFLQIKIPENKKRTPR